MYFSLLYEGGGGEHGGHTRSFSEIAFCLANLVLCYYPRHQKIFLLQHFQNFVGGLYFVWKDSYDLSSSGYGYSDFSLSNTSSYNHGHNILELSNLLIKTQ